MCAPPTPVGGISLRLQVFKSNPRRDPVETCRDKNIRPQLGWVHGISPAWSLRFELHSVTQLDTWPTRLYNMQLARSDGALDINTTTHKSCSPHARVLNKSCSTVYLPTAIGPCTQRLQVENMVSSTATVSNCV